MYQIYTDRFCNGDPTNDVQTGEYFYIGDQVQKVEDWYRYPQPMDVREFYGGDLQGVINKLDYLQSLGVEVIYCNPLFVSPSNHKYDTQDYDYIDPHVGKIVTDGGRLLEPGERVIITLINTGFVQRTKKIWKPAISCLSGWLKRSTVAE